MNGGSARQIMYICGFSSSTISELYDMSFYSLAGTHKKRNITRSLQSVGAEVTIVSPLLLNSNTFRYYSGRSLVDEETGATVHVPAAIDIYGVNFVFAVLATTLLVLRLLFRGSFDVILFYNFRAKHAVPAALGSVLFGVPTILDYEDGIFLHDNPVIRWSSRILRRVCAHIVDAAVCVNRPLADIAPTDNTVTVRGFPSIGMPDGLIESAEDPDATVVMFAGRLDRIRGVDTFVDAIRDISVPEPVEFWISGYGPDEELERVRTGIEKLDDPRVTFFGTLPWEDYRERLVAADIAVNLQDPTAPLSKYTFPSKLLDFMSSGSIIVSSDMSDLRTDFESLFYFVDDGRSPEETLTEVVTGYQQDTLRVDAKAGRSWVREHCSHETVGGNILDLISEEHGHATAGGEGTLPRTDTGD